MHTSRHENIALGPIHAELTRFEHAKSAYFVQRYRKFPLAEFCKKGYDQT